MGNYEDPNTLRIGIGWGMLLQFRFNMLFFPRVSWGLYCNFFGLLLCIVSWALNVKDYN